MPEPDRRHISSVPPPPGDAQQLAALGAELREALRALKAEVRGLLDMLGKDPAWRPIPSGAPSWSTAPPQQKAPHGRGFWQWQETPGVAQAPTASAPASGATARVSETAT